jgi:hypothetical protein
MELYITIDHEYHTDTWNKWILDNYKIVYHVTIAEGSGIRIRMHPVKLAKQLKGSLTTDDDLQLSSPRLA